MDRTIRSCGVDMILWLEIGPEESLDRCIGRRWNGEKVYHIDIEVDDVNLLQLGERGAETVEKNNFKLKNLNDMK
jgi:hypothetical protein